VLAFTDSARTEALQDVDISSSYEYTVDSTHATTISFELLAFVRTVAMRPAVLTWLQRFESQSARPDAVARVAQSAVAWKITRAKKVPSPPPRLSRET
jgi:hypothetical protein